MAIKIILYSSLRYFLNILDKRSLGVIGVIAALFIQHANAQPSNLVLQDTTITTAAAFTASNSITAGPNFTIANTGDVTFQTKDIFLRPSFVIINGGQLKVVGPVTGIETPQEPILPSEFIVQQNYPNPFNPVTHIRFGIPKAYHVRLTIYDVLGQRVLTLVNEYKTAGYHVVDFDASHLTSGVYYYHISAGEFHAVKKMILLK